ncbi:nuclear protein MDM1-like isoform X2 [Physella acuta]|uniref:nuclear protein MDM1-like isoform X2 n=1 Tax=Physella acuta TaxID=109671 RepID=UPI0027DC7B49|nr:nuclear protein MDM1-like isoform X2 [Physella acuta]
MDQGKRNENLADVLEPSLQHKKRIGGVPTSLSTQYFAGQSQAAAAEPALQHKKRLEGCPTSLSTQFFSAPAPEPEFSLLGQQEKFASNVRYQPKQTFSDEKMYKNKENFDTEAPPNKQLRMQRRIKPLLKERHPPIRRSPPKSQAAVDSPPPAPRGQRDNVEIKEGLKDKDLKEMLEEPVKQSSKPEKSSVSQPEKSSVSQQPSVDKHGDLVKNKGDSPAKASKADVTKKNVTLEKDKVTQTNVGGTKSAMKVSQDAKVSNMNESVQTNLKKGIAIATAEAPADYALKYKAGVAPPRGLQKMSEYQKQFQWKQGLKASPLLAAEQIVYKSQADLGPYKTNGIPKVSEYARQFQQWQPTGFGGDKNMNANNSSLMQAHNGRRTHKRKAESKRSKSVGAVVESDDTDDMKVDDLQFGPHSENLRSKLKKKHGQIRRAATEYRANFKSPLRYSYEHGAWKGACPPQLIPQVTSDSDNFNENNNNNSNNNAEKVPLSNWYAEVIELRRRAEEYKKRAQGTHFSREHLLQLLAKKTDSYDSSEVENSQTLKALNLEAPKYKPNTRVQRKIRQEVNSPVEICSHEATEGDSPDFSDVEDSSDDLPRETTKKPVRKSRPTEGPRKSRKMAWLEQQKENIAEQRRKLREEQRRDEEDSDEGGPEGRDQEGRLPTPLLRQQNSVRRHHLDLTTPAVGGAILTCPPTRGSKLVMTSRSGDSYVTTSDDYPVRSLAKTYNIDTFLTMPTLGQPSNDTHPLRDDSAESDRPMKMKYVISPPLPGSDDDKENDESKMQPKRKSKVPKPSNLSTLKEGFGETYKKTPTSLNLGKLQKSGHSDEDVLSESLMSVSSSSSLASQVLERTKRRQGFWSKKDDGH